MAVTDLNIDQQLVKVDGKATPYFEDYLRDLVVAVGGEGSPPLTSIPSLQSDVERVNYINGLLGDVESRLSVIESEQSNNSFRHQIAQLQVDTSGFNQKSIPSSLYAAPYSAEDKDWLNVKSGATVELPLNPPDNARVIYRSGDSTSKIIDGKGRKINGFDQQQVTREGTVLVFDYFRPEDEWFMSVNTVDSNEHKETSESLTRELIAWNRVIARLLANLYDADADDMAGDIER
jgi:hypothetical protein